ncbi:hypothetical protein, partial [Mesobacillus subterraneus]|uniref:hypothetical protein n=1 Tax=Mesobacillus subterraneus TaxID=285983 RepID=UPI001B880A76
WVESCPREASNRTGFEDLNGKLSERAHQSVRFCGFGEKVVLEILRWDKFESHAKKQSECHFNGT